MDNIVEIPLDAPEAVVEAAPEESAPEEVAPKRGRGRPKGAPNKSKPTEPKEAKPPKTTPVAKETKAPSPAKAKRSAAPAKASKKKRIVYESSSEEDIPVKKTTQEIASEVLELLSFQRANQRAQRRDRYAGWFQQM
jgi:hypothetical protein